MTYREMNWNEQTQKVTLHGRDGSIFDTTLEGIYNLIKEGHYVLNYYIKGKSLYDTEDTKLYTCKDSSAAVYNYEGGNGNLHKAKAAKNDEFYTQLCDIEAELSHYPKEYFKDKVVYLPCDRAVASSKTPISNFVVYFKNKFEELGLKKLIISWLEEDPTKNNCVILERD